MGKERKNRRPWTEIEIYVRSRFPILPASKCEKRVTVLAMKKYPWSYVYEDLKTTVGHIVIANSDQTVWQLSGSEKITKLARIIQPWSGGLIPPKLIWGKIKPRSRPLSREKAYKIPFGRSLPEKTL